MKELSIEEKAKRYDKALEIMKAYYNRTQFSSISDSKEELKTIEKAFPELKENEDERIRKSITEFFKNYSENGTWKAIPDVTKWIAWLEKQGEQKPLFKEGDTVIWDGEEFNILDVTKDSYNVGGYIIPIYRQNELSLKQKPAWSEEGERLRKEIVNYLECQKEEEPTRKDKINSWISWILKHSFSEWTKEEKEAWNKRLDCIIDILDWAEEKGRISLSDCQDYSIMLKSLRPQNHWKPSDEQIAALEHFVRSIGESGYASPYDNATKLLYSLLADLKKLREE